MIWNPNPTQPQDTWPGQIGLMEQTKCAKKWQYLAQNDQKSSFWTKFGTFGPKILIFSEGNPINSRISCVDLPDFMLQSSRWRESSAPTCQRNFAFRACHDFRVTIPPLLRICLSKGPPPGLFAHVSPSPWALDLNIKQILGKGKAEVYCRQNVNR